MLSSFLYTLLKLSKTTSPNKPFDYDCVMYLYAGIFLKKNGASIPLKNCKESQYTVNYLYSVYIITCINGKKMPYSLENPRFLHLCSFGDLVQMLTIYD